MNKEKPLVVAITGGMGCGQSTVAKYFEKFGAKVINADLVARQVVDSDPEVKEELKKAFGRRIFYRNGKLNRKLLANIVFEDQLKTSRLNKIVHPRMVARIVEEIEQARESGKYPLIAIDAALVYELNLEHMFDYVVVVTSKMSNRIRRIKERDGLSEKDIINRINKQLPIEDKMRWADFVIQNNGTLEELEEKTKKVFQQILKKSIPSRRSQRTTRRKSTRNNQK